MKTTFGFQNDLLQILAPFEILSAQYEIIFTLGSELLTDFSFTITKQIVK